MALKWGKSFIPVAGGLLVAAALVRFLILFSPAQSLALPDPFLEIPLRPAIFSAGLLELAAGLVCLFGKNLRLQTMALAWLATNWLVYRIGLMWLGIHPQGTFLGMLTDPLKLAGTPAGFVAAWLPLVFVGICYTATIDSWLGSRRENFARISCPACGGHIRFARQNLGRKISCPHCRQNVTLRRPEENLKMSCYFCQGHIEFPPHAIGEKMPCPHCKMDITLKEPA